MHDIINDLGYLTLPELIQVKSYLDNLIKTKKEIAEMAKRLNSAKVKS